MKLGRLLEDANARQTLRKLALRLQTELQEDEHLGTIVDDIELSSPSARVNIYDEMITLHLSGPLFELCMDVSYKIYKINVGHGGGPPLDFTVELRVDKKDLPGDGVNIASSMRDPLAWFTTSRLVTFMLSKTPADTDMHRYNFLWFDKISKNLDQDYKLFLKSIRVDESQIMTSQIIDEANDKRYALEFCHHPEVGYCYKLGLYNRPNEMRIIEDFSDINEILRGEE